MTGADLMKALEDIGTTQAEVARRAGMSKQAFHRYLSRYPFAKLPPAFVELVTPILRELKTEALQRLAGAMTD